MKQIIETFGILFLLLLHIFSAAALITVSGDVAMARQYKADVISEIENSNFNPNVMLACQNHAAELGYQLEITDCVYDERYDMRTAKVALQYQYQIPIFGISQTKYTYGIAR